jgi:ABC-type transport system involved in cytochrome c biogenesis permease subunit
MQALLLSVLFHIISAVISFSRLFFSRWRYSWVALAAGFTASGILMALRAVESGRLPVAGIGETLLFYGWLLSGLTLLVVLRYGERTLELFTVPISIGALIGSFFLIGEPGALPLILRTWWFEAHVLTSFIAYALFTVAFVAATLSLARPENVDFRSMAEKGVLWGFFFFSVSMFSGAIWGYLAWGAYWLWEPKILWSFIVWFWYAAAMHALYVREWRGMVFSVLTVMGFAVVAFTWLGVGLLMKSSHSF